jgi:hypothetical protein
MIFNPMRGRGKADSYTRKVGISKIRRVLSESRGLPLPWVYEKVIFFINKCSTWMRSATKRHVGKKMRGEIFFRTPPHNEVSAFGNRAVRRAEKVDRKVVFFKKRKKSVGKRASQTM